MKVILPDVIVLYMENNDEKIFLKRIEEIGRVCYKSEDKITDYSSKEIANGILHLFQYICPIVFDDIKNDLFRQKKYREILIDMQLTENETTLLFHYDSYIKMIEHKGIMLDHGWKCMSVKENFNENLSKTGVAYYVEYKKNDNRIN